MQKFMRHSSLGRRWKAWFSLMGRHPRAKHWMSEAGQSRKPTTTTMIVTGARVVEAALSPGPISSTSTVRRDFTSLKNVGSCRIKRKGTVKIKPMVRPLLFLVPKTLMRDIVLLFLLVVLLVMMSGYLILRVPFISALTEIDSVPMSLCRAVILCAWVMITCVWLLASALFRSWWGHGFLIFRQILDNYRCRRSETHRSGFRS